jgi:glucans biosynthesis protein
MRLHLTLALITVALLWITLHPKKHRFTFSQVQTLAEQRAHNKYKPLPDVLPPALKNLTPQQEAGIFWKEDYRLWRKKGLPFQVDFYHISKAFPSGPRVNTVDRKGAHPLAYSPTFFNFGQLAFNPPLPGTLPYAGFYLRYPLPTATETKPNVLNGFFSAMGGNYFRVLAQDQVYGISARAVAINTAINGKTEEFPQFTDWWLQEPAPDATQLVFDAIIDGPSVTGAYEFRIRPGAVTSVDVHATLFFRQGVERLGLAPFSSMYLYGENAKNHFGDSVHPEIHDSDGLIVNNSKGEWLWRPLEQEPQLQLYNFTDENPRGFGLVQRDRDFQHYQDLAARYNVRPSVWVTPHGKWGKGSIQLTQLPTNNTNTDNVVLFWRPDQQPKAGDRLDLDYTVDFYMNDATRPPLAYCAATFVNDPAPPPPPPPPSVSPGAPPSLASIVPLPATTPPAAKPPPPAKKPAPAGTTPVQFLVDFMGNGLETLPASSPPDLELDCSPPGTVVRESSVEKNGYDNSWRVTFTIIPFKHTVPTELKCRLMPHASVNHLRDELAQLHDQIDHADQTKDTATANNLRTTVLPQKEKNLSDAETRPLTETWTYTWHQ